MVNLLKSNGHFSIYKLFPQLVVRQRKLQKKRLTVLKENLPFATKISKFVSEILNRMHWKIQFNKGKFFLSQKKLHKALQCFESAVTDCPVSADKGLERSLFFLGLTLKKLGHIDSALRCWQIAGKLKNNGSSVEMAQKHSNSYGMSQGDCNIREDKDAFLGIQLEKYLKKKRVKRFCSDAEKDVIKEIILTHWHNMLCEGDFSQFSIEKKIKLFKEQTIIFPFADISYIENESHIIFTDFHEGKPVSMNDFCSCGSGIRFNQCCGRIKTAEELEIGEF